MQNASINIYNLFLKDWMYLMASENNLTFYFLITNIQFKNFLK